MNDIPQEAEPVRPLTDVEQARHLVALGRKAKGLPPKDAR